MRICGISEMGYADADAGADMHEDMRICAYAHMRMRI